MFQVLHSTNSYKPKQQTKIVCFYLKLMIVETCIYF